MSTISSYFKIKIIYQIWMYIAHKASHFITFFYTHLSHTNNTSLIMAPPWIVFFCWLCLFFFWKCVFTYSASFSIRCVIHVVCFCAPISLSNASAKLSAFTEHRTKTALPPCVRCEIKVCATPCVDTIARDNNKDYVYVRSLFDVYFLLRSLRAGTYKTQQFLKGQT